MPPVRTGIAACSAQIVARVSRTHLIDVYPEREAHDFIPTHLRAPYDLIVYQLGNSSHHDYIWPYLFRYPGLSVLHDVHLHHARAPVAAPHQARGRLSRGVCSQRAGGSPGAAELAVHGFDNHLYYTWPMTRLVIEASRATAVHTPLLVEQLRARHRSATVTGIRLSQGEPIAGARASEARSRVRSRHAIPDDAVLFGVFGGLAPEKRVTQVLDAMTATMPYCPEARLLLAGGTASHFDLMHEVRARKLESFVSITGYLETDNEFTDHVAACDVSLNLRWPTAREVSGPWLRALAAGRATVITDLAHLADVPALDPRTWRVPPTGAVRAAGPAPVAVAIDLLDEDHSLRLAMRRLATDAGLRAQLGGAALEYWQEHHSPEAMLEDYESAIELAMNHPAPAMTLPRHLRVEPEEHVRLLLAPFGAAGAPVVAAFRADGLE